MVMKMSDGSCKRLDQAAMRRNLSQVDHGWGCSLKQSLERVEVEAAEFIGGQGDEA